MKTLDVIEKVREVCRLQHLAYSTEKTYCHWIGIFCRYLTEHNPAGSSTEKVEAFLTSEARRGVSASTQNQAFAAILFLYRNILKIDLENVDALRAKKPDRIRHAPSREDVAKLLRAVTDRGGYPTRLIVHLIYACGLRVNEPLGLRLKDVDTTARRLIIRDPKHGHDRAVKYSDLLADQIAAQVTKAEQVHAVDRDRKMPVQLPGLLAKKYPAAAYDRAWAWLFPLANPCADPRTGQTVRWHCLDQTVQRAVAAARRDAGIGEIITPHHLRHAFATHAAAGGAFVRDIQAVMGHRNIETTMGYLHAEADRVISPLEALQC